MSEEGFLPADRWKIRKYRKKRKRTEVAWKKNNWTFHWLTTKRSAATTVLFMMGKHDLHVSVNVSRHYLIMCGLNAAATERAGPCKVMGRCERRVVRGMMDKLKFKKGGGSFSVADFAAAIWLRPAAFFYSDGLLAGPACLVRRCVILGTRRTTHATCRSMALLHDDKRPGRATDLYKSRIFANIGVFARQAFGYVLRPSSRVSFSRRLQSWSSLRFR
jgi:hypothetical protein